MVKDDKLVSMAEAIAHQILQIQIAERSVQDARQLGSELLVRQYQHLKKEFIKQLNDMLANANLWMNAVEPGQPN